MAEVTPVTLVLGFPGAGKTTLCARLAAADFAIVAVQPDAPMWWRGLCPCCAPRDDVARALRTLLPRARRGEVRRIVLETTGLADPGPILATLLSDTVAAAAYALDGIITVVDAADGATWLDAQDVAVRQITTADRIVLRHDERTNAAALRDRLCGLNPGATLMRDDADASMLWSDWHQRVAPIAMASPAAPQPGIEAFCLSFDDEPQAIIAALETLVAMHGASLLRIKGLLHGTGQSHPIAVNGVQHLWFPPRPLPASQHSAPHGSRVLFITRGLSRTAVAAALHTRLPVPAG